MGLEISGHVSEIRLVNERRETACPAQLAMPRATFLYRQILNRLRGETAERRPSAPYSPHRNRLANGPAS